jgi:hypothetical protein
VKLCSGSGRRELASIELEERARTPTIRRVTAEGISIFQASHREADGTWVYRRVGVEKGAR